MVSKREFNGPLLDCYRQGSRFTKFHERYCTHGNDTNLPPCCPYETVHSARDFKGKREGLLAYRTNVALHALVVRTPPH